MSASAAEVLVSLMFAFIMKFVGSALYICSILDIFIP